MFNTLLSYKPEQGLSGTVLLPGDKSISHRALMLASIADGKTKISGFLSGEDCIATLHALQDLGVSIDHHGTDVTVEGVGLGGLRPSSSVLNLGNSGTSMRLLAGLLAGQPFTSRCTGDESLNRRPMQRIMQPLCQMGASIESVEGHAPLTITGRDPLKGIDYTMPIASAQVKSCLLLAGLYADSNVRVTEPHQSRDHTERMLEHFGVRLKRLGLSLTVEPGQRLTAKDLQIPADISSAAFFIVAATIVPNSDVILRQVGINATRDGIIHLLKMMGADIECLSTSNLGNEPVADLRVRYAPLTGIEIPVEWVANAIDEFPILMIAAACASGKTIIRGAEELRVKESDRLAVMVEGLQRCGIHAVATPDGAIIEGGTLHAGTIESHGDHRIAMAFAVAGLRATGEVRIHESMNIATSFPSFLECAAACGMPIEGR